MVSHCTERTAKLEQPPLFGHGDMTAVFRVLSSYLLAAGETESDAQHSQPASMNVLASARSSESESEPELPAAQSPPASEACPNGHSRKREQWTPQEKLMLIKSAKDLGGPEPAAERYVQSGGPVRRKVSKAAIAGNIRKWAARVRNVQSDDRRLELLACRRHGITRRGRERRAARAAAVLRAEMEPQESTQRNYFRKRVIQHPEWGGEGRDSPSPESAVMES